jgi:hypothetical protein
MLSPHSAKLPCSPSKLSQQIPREDMDAGPCAACPTFCSFTVANCRRDEPVTTMLMLMMIYREGRSTERLIIPIQLVG